MRKVSVAILAIILLAQCAGVQSTAETFYRDPARARAVLTAFQTLRYHSAELVAEAYVKGQITKEHAQLFAAVDDKFTKSWGVAADLVNLWLVSKGPAPRGLQEHMTDMEKLGAELEAMGRQVE